MKDDRTTPHASSEKRGPGFVKIRRGLLPHLAGMSSNAVKLYVWLQLRAYWSGPKRGWVEASYEDIRYALRWSYSMVRRTVGELARKDYIMVAVAANQHELTRIKILKYDHEDSSSAVLTRERSKDSAVSSAMSTREQTREHSDHSNQQMSHDLSTSKKSKNIRRAEYDAVRRKEDAGHHNATSRFSPSEKREKLHARMIAKVTLAGDSFQNLNHRFSNEEQEAFEALGYKPNPGDPLLTGGFVEAAVEVYEKHRGQGLSRGILCSKVIDYCRTKQECAKTLGDSGSEYYWPPDFQVHRDRLRAQEKRTDGNGGRL